MKGAHFVWPTLMLGACGFGPDPGGPFRVSAELPLPPVIMGLLPEGVAPSDVYTRTGNVDLAGCYYHDRDGLDVLLDCVR